MYIIYDFESGLYYLKSRYYNPSLGIFIQPDKCDYLEFDNINGYNLYTYCNNNPVMYSDPEGHLPRWTKNLLGVFFDVASVGIGIIVGITFNPIAGFMATAVFNNIVNSIYYNYLSSGESKTTSSSYTNRYVSRWDRLDYIKKCTNSKSYSFNSMRFYGEYSLHMYGHYTLPWVDNFDSAEINNFDFDKEHGKLSFAINIASILFGLLGV